MKEKNGISLIVLIVTIIVMIIIAGAVIISLTETNVIDQAEAAVAKQNLAEMKSAASMAYADWLANEYESDENKQDKGHVQNYIRNELIKQGVATWEDFSKWYITPTGGIEEIDQEAFTLMLKIPEDNYKFLLSINTDGGCEIDWGDESEIEFPSDLVDHIYAKKGIYEVKITGNCYMLYNNEDQSQEIFAIKSWGKVGLNYIYIEEIPIEYMSLPNEESFEGLMDFYCKSMRLQEIPDYLFKNCNNLEEVDLKECPNLKYIPEHLFEGVTDISAITKEFPEGLEVPVNW